MPLFNRLDLVDESINSVVKQTYHFWELIIIDDGSTDGSYDRAVNWSKKDNRIKVFSRDRLPKSASTCRNIGFGKSVGDYIIFMDSDDLLIKECLTSRIAFFEENKDQDFLVFPILVFEEKPNDTLKLWNVVNPPEDDLSLFLRGDALWQTMGPIYNRTSLQNLPFIFDESLVLWQDFELHLRLLIKGFRYKKLLDIEPDCLYRKHKKTISQSGKVNENFIQSRKRVVESTYYLLKASPYKDKSNQLKILFVNQVLKELIKNNSFDLGYKVLLVYQKMSIINEIDFIKLFLFLTLNKFEKSLPFKGLVYEIKKKLIRRYKRKINMCKVNYSSVSKILESAQDI